MRKKIISFALSAMLILTFIPQISFADEDDAVDMAAGEEITTEAQNSSEDVSAEEQTAEGEPAAEDSAEGEEETPFEDDPDEELTFGVITGFVPLETTEYYYEGDPEEGELAISLPGYLNVYMDGSDEVSEIPVSWEAVEDFDHTDFYFYSMKPVWDEGIVLSEDLDALVDVPWITVYRQEPANEDIEPIMTEEELDPIYTEEDGPVNPETGEPVESVEGSQDDPDEASGFSLKSIALDTAGAVIDATTEESYAASASNTAAVYKYLKDKMGLNTAAACGVMTNLNAESAMSPTNLQNTYNSRFGLSDSAYTKAVDKGKGSYKTSGGRKQNFKTDRGGYGLCQWTSSGRKTKLLKRALSEKKSIGNINMQLGYLNTELQSYQSVLTTLRNVPNNAAGAYIAAAEFCLVFEAPANTISTAASRGRNCLSGYWKTYSGSSASASGSSFVSLCGYSYPLKLKKGKGMDVTGYAVSNYKITSLTGKILNSSGNTVYFRTVKPNSTAAKLYSLDSAMKFAKLGVGSYTYVVTAKDSKGGTVKAAHKFSVAANITQTKALGFASVAKTGASPVNPSRATQPTTTTTKKGYTGTFPKLPKRGYFKKGDKGKQVKNLQRFLKWYGYSIKVDGKCGKNTIKCVKKFQKSVGMKATGRFGKKTLAKAKKVKK